MTLKSLDKFLHFYDKFSFTFKRKFHLRVTIRLTKTIFPVSRFMKSVLSDRISDSFGIVTQQSFSYISDRVTEIEKNIPNVYEKELLIVQNNYLSKYYKCSDYNSCFCQRSVTALWH